MLPEKVVAGRIILPARQGIRVTERLFVEVAKIIAPAANHDCTVSCLCGSGRHRIDQLRAVFGETFGER